MTDSQLWKEARNIHLERALKLLKYVKCLNDIWYLVDTKWTVTLPVLHQICVADKGSSQSLQELGDDCDFHFVNEALISAGWWRVKVGTGFFSNTTSFAPSWVLNCQHFVKASLLYIQGKINSCFPLSLWNALCILFLGFPGNSAGKESTCNAGDPGLIPGLGRSPGGGHSNPLQFSCLENPRGQRSLVSYGHGVAKSWTWLKD